MITKSITIKASISTELMILYRKLGLECFVVNKNVDGNLKILKTDDHLEFVCLILLGDNYLAVKNKSGKNIYFDIDLENDAIIEAIEFDCEVLKWIKINFMQIA